MTAPAAPLLATGSLRASHGTDRAQLAAAAKQFEAIFVRQMLAAARKTHFGGDALDSQGMDTFRTMQDANFADLAANTGAFGIARQIEAALQSQLGIALSRPRDGTGEGLLRGPAKQALPQPLPQAGGTLTDPSPSARRVSS